MDNLIENYNSKCQTISSIPDNMWKKGVIITFILFSLVYFATHRMIMCILSFTILFVVWFYICEFVYNRELKRKVGNICKKSNVKGKNKYSEYEQILDEYQKNYISNYVRKK